MNTTEVKQSELSFPQKDDCKTRTTGPPQNKDPTCPGILKMYVLSVVKQLQYQMLSYMKVVTNAWTSEFSYTISHNCVHLVTIE